MGRTQYTQSGLQLSLESPFGQDKLLLRKLSGREDVSRPFLFHLEMLSRDSDLPPEGIVGKPVCATLILPDESTRFFQGVVTSFTNCGSDDRFCHYKAQVVPTLWLLNLRFDCRIFQELTVPQIIERVLTGAGLTDFEKSEVRGTHPKRDYCVQYRESDFNFVSRLMELEGIFYYFRHERNRHVLVLADQMGAFKDCPESQLDFAAFEGAVEPTEKLTAWTHRYQFHTGKCSHTDYNFETPSANLRVSTNTVVNWDKIKQYEAYDYPGGYSEQGWGKAELKLRMEEVEVCHDVVEGTGVCRSFCPGGKFTIINHQNKLEEGKTFALLSVGHSISLGGAYLTGGNAALEYSNSFTCIPIGTTFRPPRITPKPLVQGFQPAVVVGPSGEEIYTDHYGRVKVQFFWDRQGKNDDKSSCWLRVSQTWAGKHWGALAIPRIGQEVMVAFLEGDPDRPVVAGSVYNAEQMPPYTLPAEKTKAMVKSNSSKGGVGFNEIRFEDLNDKEQLFIHAERNLDLRVKSEEMESVSGHRHLIVGSEKDGKKVGDQREMVYQDKHLKIHRHQVEQIGGDMQLLVGGIDGPGNQDIVVKNMKKETIGDDDHLHVKGKRNEQVDGDQSLTIGGSQQEKVGQKHALEAGVEIHLKAGMTLILESGAQLTLKVGGNFVDINPAGVFIQGTMVMINSGGAPGAGSGSAPSTPTDAMEAAPTEPAAADNAKTGQKSAKT